MKELFTKKHKFYRLNKIDETGAHYRIIFGERSNGKTYAVKERILENYAKDRSQGALIRRWYDDFKGNRGQTMFEDMITSGVVERLFGEEYNTIIYRSRQWFLALREKNEIVAVSETPFCYGFALTGMEHDKSTSYPNIRTVLFDEFITRSFYLPDEFVIFVNVLSTIIRVRDDVVIYMCGNTVNKYLCPYFTEMGLSNVKKMEQNTIDVYKYGESNLTVAVEYCGTSQRNSKPSDVYFAFNNPKLEMIKTGAWELSIYPHCPCKYLPKDVVFSYFLEFEETLLQCDIVSHETFAFTFIHRKTTPIKDENKDIIYRPIFTPQPNIHRNIIAGNSAFDRKAYSFFINRQVYYQDNEVGEIVRSYLMFCKQDGLITS